MSNNSLSRRSFLKFAGGAFGVAALAACAPQPGAAPAAPAAEEGGDAAPAAETGSLWVILDIDFHDTYNEHTQTRICRREGLGT